MIVAGGAIAVLIMIAIAVAQRNGDPSIPVNNAPDRTRLGASILFHLLLQGGTEPAAALQKLRSVGLIAPVTAGIDLASWSERYAHVASPEQRAWLLETAVQLVSAAGQPVPLRQYAALLDLSFSLGFQTDALAKLREQYGFDYVDYAKDARPRRSGKRCEPPGNHLRLSQTRLAAPSRQGAQQTGRDSVRSRGPIHRNHQGLRGFDGYLQGLTGVLESAWEFGLFTRCSQSVCQLFPSVDRS